MCFLYYFYLIYNFLSFLFYSIVSMLDVLPSLFISLHLSGQYKVLQPGNPEIKVAIFRGFIGGNRGLCCFAWLKCIVFGYFPFTLPNFITIKLHWGSLQVIWYIFHVAHLTKTNLLFADGVTSLRKWEPTAAVGCGQTTQVCTEHKHLTYQRENSIARHQPAILIGSRVRLTKTLPWVLT